VCVPDLLGVLAVWRKNKNKTKKKRLYTLVCVPDVIGRLTVWQSHNKTKTKSPTLCMRFHTLTGGSRKLVV